MTNNVSFLSSVRIIENTINFKIFNSEHTVLIPSQDINLLTDIYLQIYGHPSYLETGRQVGIGLDDLHVYLNQYDVTNSIIVRLRNNLDNMDQERVKSQYKKALDNWLKLEENLGATYPGKGIGKDRDIAKRNLEMQPISANLSKLGDMTSGWGGNLHIFNFLYKQIDLSTVSLKKVIEHYNSTAMEPVDLSNLGSIRITFSVGTCRLFSSAWSSIHPLPAGSLTYRLEFNYHDPLIDKVLSLEKKVNDLKTEISSRLKSILNAVGPEGQITKILNGQKDMVTEDFKPGLKDRVITLNNQLENCQREIKSLQEQMNIIQQNSIPDLNKSIDRIK